MVKFKVEDVDFDKVYPVGAIYMSVSPTDPANLFGGEWERIKDTFLLACGDTYDGGSTGGEATHTLTVSEMPEHSHKTGNRAAYGSGNANATIGYYSSASTSTADTSSTGAGQAHNNMPPYLAVFVWVRTG